MYITLSRLVRFSNLLKSVFLKVKNCKVVSCACAVGNYSTLRARLPHAAPGCSRFLGRPEHTCGMRASRRAQWDSKQQPLNTSVSQGVGSTTEPFPTPVTSYCIISDRADGASNVDSDSMIVSRVM